jgi:hypothetical protein
VSTQRLHSSPGLIALGKIESGRAAWDATGRIDVLIDRMQD